MSHRSSAGFAAVLGSLVLVFAAALAIVPEDAVAQQPAQVAVSSFTPDENLAATGKKVWKQKQCDTCHSIGEGRRAGPDLAGLTERRPLDWIKSFLKDPLGMVEDDPVAQELFQEYNGTRMPDLKLRDTQIEALIHYVALEGAKKAGPK